MNFINKSNTNVMKAVKCQETAEKCQMRVSEPRHSNVVQYINFWTKKSQPEVKGGSFNLELYMQYLLNQEKL